jgi:hypothetical protein
MADGQEPADVEPEVVMAAPLPMVMVGPSNRELPPEVADEIGRFSDPRCGRCDCRLAGVSVERGRCDRCYEHESTERAISDVNGRYREDLTKTPPPFQSAVARLVYGAQVWRDRLALAEREIGGPPLVGNEVTPGKRYLPLFPVFDTASREIIGWQLQLLEPGGGSDGRLYRTPESARKQARERGRDKIRVLEIDIVDQRDVDLSPSQRYEHAERMVFRWTEEEIATRPGARVEPSTERRDFMPPALRAMALSAQRTTEQTNTYLCLQCAQNPRELGLPFCVPCAADVLDKLGRAVSATASIMGQMEATDRTVGAVGRRENIPDGPDVASEIEVVPLEEYVPALNVGEPLEIADLGTEPGPGP